MLFLANDVASLRRLPREWRSEPVLLRWTAREALLKALGETLDELGRIGQVQFNEGPEIREACVSRGQSMWWIRTIRPAFEIVGSIAVDAPGLRVVQQQLGKRSRSDWAGL
jgi:phosphopantetheinyl transferase